MTFGKSSRFLCWASLLSLLVACAAKEQSNPVRIRATPPVRQSHVAGEYIVTATSPEADADTVRRVYAAFGIETLQTLGGGRFLIRLARDPGVARVQSVGRDSGRIQAVQPNYVYRQE